MAAVTTNTGWPLAGLPSRAGCDPGACRYVDPDRDRPELTVFELGPDGRYAQVGLAAGATSFPARKPFVVDIVPERLVAGLFPR